MWPIGDGHLVNETVITPRLRREVNRVGTLTHLIQGARKVTPKSPKSTPNRLCVLSDSDEVDQPSSCICLLQRPCQFRHVLKAQGVRHGTALTYLGSNVKFQDDQLSENLVLISSIEA